jgi:hypothetical protein
MTADGGLDLTELRSTWQARRAAARDVLRRLDPRGMTRPPRAPLERAWLEEHGGSPFVEDEACAAAARRYYERKYRRRP